MKTSFKALPEHWDFKLGKYRSSVRGSLELINELNELGLKVLKGFIKLKEEKKFIESDDLKALLNNSIVTFVTLMIEKGVPLTMIQKITQHSDLRTLLKYEGHNDKSLENAFEKT